MTMTRERLDEIRRCQDEERAERDDPSMDWRIFAVDELLAEVERLERARVQAQQWLDEFQGMCGKAAFETLQWKARAEAAERDAKAAERSADEQIALNSRTLDAIVELLRPGQTLDDDGILAAVRALVALRDAVSAERECLRRWHAATAKPWPEADDDAIGLGMEYSRMFDATNEALVEAKKERA